MKSYKIYEEQEYSRMVYVEGGSFLLEDKIETEISDFWIGQYIVSQELWKKVMGNNPSKFRGKDLPIEAVSWYDALVFCNALSEVQGMESVYKIDKSIKDGNNRSMFDKLKWKIEINDLANGYRVLREVEWEYAARGGLYSLRTRFSGSTKITKVSFFGGFGEDASSHRETQILGIKAPNELGLYDMSGNVKEWCQGWANSYSEKSFLSNKDPERGRGRALRGGSWVHDEDHCVISYRESESPDSQGTSYSLRLARTAL